MIRQILRRLIEVTSPKKKKKRTDERVAFKRQKGTGEKKFGEMREKERGKERTKKKKSFSSFEVVMEKGA